MATARGTGYKQGERHHNWVGDKVKYAGLHLWVGRHLEKPRTCNTCSQEKKLDLANITGIYDRDFNNWSWLCRKCHMSSDGRMNKYSFRKGSNKFTIWPE